VSPFIGSQTCKVDNKGRITIPATFRRFLGTDGETLVVTKSGDPCLRLYTPEGWQAFQDKLNALPGGKEKKLVVRFFSLNSAILQVDKQGRVALPRDFMSEYGMGDEVQLLGTIENIEVWRPEDLRVQVKDAPAALEKLEPLL